jgi:putative toxin-antitoxin system antitoxin component (TIGR02293 family)
LKDHIGRGGLNQVEAAKLLGVTQPRVSDLLRGKINLFGLDTLVNMTAAAGLRIEFRVRQAEEGAPQILAGCFDAIEPRLPWLRRIQMVFDILAVAASADRGVEALLRTHGIIRAGFLTQTLDDFVAAGHLTSTEVYQLIAPHREINRRRKLGSLTPHQSDRLFRIGSVIATAHATFQSQAKANVWLRRPLAALGDEAPIALLETAAGASIIENLLGRISWGAAA